MLHKPYFSSLLERYFIFRWDKELINKLNKLSKVGNRIGVEAQSLHWEEMFALRPWDLGVELEPWQWGRERRWRETGVQRMRNLQRPPRRPCWRGRRKTRIDGSLKSQAKGSDASNEGTKCHIGKDRAAAVGFSNFPLVTFARVSFSKLWGPKARRLLLGWKRHRGKEEEKDTKFFEAVAEEQERIKALSRGASKKSFLNEREDVKIWFKNMCMYL